MKNTLQTDQGNRGWYSRGYLPHFDSANVIQTVTYRLADSLPKQVIEMIKDESIASRESMRMKIDTYLDKGHGSCYLQNPEIATIIETNFKYFHGKKYDLIAWVIMPNHVHVMIKQYNGSKLEKIVHSWKSYTASESNKILNRKGVFWLKDYWDRYIRNEKHLNGTIEYIHENPVRAGLVKHPEEWLFSSARLYLQNPLWSADSLVCNGE